MITLKELLKNTSIETMEFGSKEVRSVAVDSRRVEPGDLFCVVEGTKENGEHFLKDALKRGASAVLAAKSFPLPSGIPLFLSKEMRDDLAIIAGNLYSSGRPLDLFAVTGTNGKTSTVKILYELLGKAGIKAGYITTIEEFDGKKTVPSDLTTPDSFHLHSFFSRLSAHSGKACVMEASSHGIHQKRLHGLVFKAKILTNITQDHLDYHKTLEEYKAVKRNWLLEGTEPVIVNLRDPVGAEIFQKRKNVYTYGIDCEKADLKALHAEYDSEGLVFDLCYGEKVGTVKVKGAIGFFMIENLLAAALTALVFGVDFDLITKGLESFVPPVGRMSRIKEKGIEVYVDFAHTPDALEKSIQTLRPLVKGKLRVVFGCGGNRDKLKRPEMGRIADKNADVLYVTSDNSRWEETADILNDIRRGVTRKDNISYEEDRAKAIARAVRESEKGDIVLIAGKGHETYQDLKGIKKHFSDFEEAEKALRGKENVQ